MVRPEAASALKDLGGVGIKKFLVLTGDSQATTQAVATSLGLTEFHAGLLPADKEKIIGGYSNVMMVGDGVNDAPSLARANIGVAMGGLGSDIALNSADVVLMQDRLSSLVDLIRLGRSTNRIIRANLTFAAGMIVFLVVGSFVTERFAPRLSNAILPFAVFGHEGSTVLVILNGLRLLRGPMR
jgi:Cd2+/Zn2+-exporting ATPase